MGTPQQKSNVQSEKKSEVVKVPFFWVRDASGHRSVSVTLLVVSFFVTTLAFVLSIFSKIGPVEIRPFDVAACSTYMVPILTLYFSRRWTDARHGITQLRESAQNANTPLVEPLTNNNGIVSDVSGFPPNA
jgi:hypothetical protein